MSSLHYHEPPRDICLGGVSQHFGWLDSQDIGPVLTMLVLLALRAVLHSFGPHLTRHGTCVNHACPPNLPFTLDVEHGWETIFHGDLATLVLHTCSNIISSKDFFVHQSPKPTQHMLGATH